MKHILVQSSIAIDNYIQHLKPSHCEERSEVAISERINSE